MDSFQLWAATAGIGTLSLVAVHLMVFVAAAVADVEGDSGSTGRSSADLAERPATPVEGYDLERRYLAGLIRTEDPAGWMATLAVSALGTSIAWLCGTAGGAALVAAW